MLDDMEQVNNESIDMTYLRKRYTNTSPTGHNISFTERDNLPYSFLLVFIYPRDIVTTTQFSGWGSSSVFINPPKYYNSHQNNDSPRSIPYLVIKNHIISQRQTNEYLLNFLLRYHKTSSIHWIFPTN